MGPAGRETVRPELSVRKQHECWLPVSFSDEWWAPNASNNYALDRVLDYPLLLSERSGHYVEELCGYGELRSGPGVGFSMYPSGCVEASGQVSMCSRFSVWPLALRLR